MANNPFGAFGQAWGPGMQASFGPGPSAAGGDLETLARQYWGAWGDALRAASGQPAVQPGMQQWHDAVDWWSKLAHGGRSEANDVVERFNTQARNWFGQMQQVAAQFAGQDNNPGQIADAWKQALGAAGENPFPEIFRAMRGHGQQGLDQWVEDASPYLDAWRREGASWLSIPAFGIGREHQERMQGLAQSQADYQEANSAYNALMIKASQHAFELFETKLAEREEPGRQLTSARALFDLWIDAAEESYAQIALSQEFRKAYGALVNAQMRMRSGIQREVELACGMFGIPTRTEVDSAHRKIVELERQLRRARDAGRGSASSDRAPRSAPAPRKQPAKKKAPAKRTASRAAVSAPAAKAARKAAPKRVARATAIPARKAAPASLLIDIATPVHPEAPNARKGKTGNRSATR